MGYAYLVPCPCGGYPPLSVKTDTLTSAVARVLRVPIPPIIPLDATNSNLWICVAIWGNAVAKRGIVLSIGYAVCPSMPQSSIIMALHIVAISVGNAANSGVLRASSWHHVCILLGHRPLTKGDNMTEQTRQRIEFNQKMMDRARMHKDWATWFDLLLNSAKLQNQADLEDQA